LNQKRDGRRAHGVQGHGRVAAGQRIGTVQVMRPGADSFALIDRFAPGAPVHEQNRRADSQQDDQQNEPTSFHQTSTGPFGTGICSRRPTAGSVMKEATSGAGRYWGFNSPFSSRN